MSLEATGRDGPPGAHADAVQWLDGLAGRSGSSDSDGQHQGMLLRQALLDKPMSGFATWAEIERLATGDSASAPQPQPQPQAARSEPAANQPWLQRRFGLLAFMSIGATALAAYLWQPEPAVMRGGATAGIAHSVWLTDDAPTAADRLASELRALGARVDVKTDANGATLDVHASQTSIAAVNRRLEALETGVDAGGRLMLQVKDIKSSER
jgi:hypothetical protein